MGFGDPVLAIEPYNPGLNCWISAVILFNEKRGWWMLAAIGLGVLLGSAGYVICSFFHG